MDYRIPKKGKSCPSKLVKPIIPLIRTEKDGLEPYKYIDHTYCKTPGDSTSGKYMINIPIFGSSTPEEWIIFMNLVQNSLVGQMLVLVHPCMNTWKG